MSRVSGTDAAAAWGVPGVRAYDDVVQGSAGSGVWEYIGDDDWVDTVVVFGASGAVSGVECAGVMGAKRRVF